MYFDSSAMTFVLGIPMVMVLSSCHLLALLGCPAFLWLRLLCRQLYPHRLLIWLHGQRRWTWAQRLTIQAQGVSAGRCT